MKIRHLLAVVAAIAVAGPGVIMAVAHFAPAAAQASDEVQVPYWASISVDRARMRKGPSIDVPVLWEYRRKDLPVRVIARHDLWRKVEDPDRQSVLEGKRVSVRVDLGGRLFIKKK